MAKVRDIENAYGFSPADLADWEMVGELLFTGTINESGHSLAQVDARHPGIEMSVLGGDITPLISTVSFWLRS